MGRWEETKKLSHEFQGAACVLETMSVVCVGVATPWRVCTFCPEEDFGFINSVARAIRPARRILFLRRTPISCAGAIFKAKPIKRVANLVAHNKIVRAGWPAPQKTASIFPLSVLSASAVSLSVGCGCAAPYGSKSKNGG